jgi:hypothetical protein
MITKKCASIFLVLVEFCVTNCGKKHHVMSWLWVVGNMKQHELLCVCEMSVAIRYTCARTVIWEMPNKTHCAGFLHIHVVDILFIINKTPVAVIRVMGHHCWHTCFLYLSVFLTCTSYNLYRITYLILVCYISVLQFEHVRVYVVKRPFF